MSLINEDLMFGLCEEHHHTGSDNPNPLFPPDGLLTLDESKSDVNPHIIAPDPFESDDCLNVFPPPHLSLLTKTDKHDTMSAGDDEPPSGLNGRLRPRKSNVIKPDIPKVVRKETTRASLDRPKRTSTPSKASPNKQDDLLEKSDTQTQFLCAFCDKKFASKQTALKHARRIHLPGSKQDNFINCLFCNHCESNSIEIIRHMVDNHPNQYFACLDCQSRFSSTSELSEHKLICDKPKVSYRSKLRQYISGSKKKKSRKNTKDDFVVDSKDLLDRHDLNGIVISCELKPSQVRNEDDIEDNITTNLILPPGKSLPNNATLEKNAVIVLDDLQWNKRIPSNFSFHNSDTDQILSRLGVVHRSPRNPEPSKRERLKLIDASTQKFERCFDTSFYTKVASNVQENLSKFLDGSFNFNPDPENIINTRKSKNSVVINTAEGFPILLASEQYSRNVLEGYLPRAIAPKHKWKWDNNDAEKIQLNPDQIKRDFHTNKCIITLISSLDMWTQLRMKRKYEEKFNLQPIEEKTEKQNAISRELKEILESREIPSTSQVVTYKNKPASSSESFEFPSSLGLTPVVPNHDIKPAVLSGEWVRPRCYVCCACGAQTWDPRSLTSHMSTQHPNAQVQHYEVVGDLLLNSDILKHLYVPPSQVANRTRSLRGIRDCTKCKKSISLEELHQHMLDCAGDTPTVRRRQVRYRPFGVRKRRPRLPDNTVRKKIRKDIRNRQRNQKTHMRPRPRIRTEVGDAETIRKMIADLPAKRHRVLVNPSNQISRPRRQLERQRNKMMMRKVKSLETKSKDTNSNKETEVASNKETSNTDEPAENLSDEDSKKKSRSLRAQANRVRQLRNTRQSQALKRKAVINKAIKRSLRQREQKANNELLDKPTVRPNISKINTDKISVDNQSKRIDVKVGAYNTREQANRGGNNNRDNNREERRPENNESNANNNNNPPPPTQSVPLKHSIARLTANTERHDKSVQFHHLFLVQQECNNSDQHDIPSGQHMLFENEPALSRLDKPPLEGHIKASSDFYKNNKQNKLRKGLNDCIAMLKNKLTDPEPGSCMTGHSVKCGSDEIIDVHAPVVLPQNMPPLSIASEPTLPVFVEPPSLSPATVSPVPVAPLTIESTPVAAETVPIKPKSTTPGTLAPQTMSPVSMPLAPAAVEPVPRAPVSKEPVPVATESTEAVIVAPVTKTMVSMPSLPTTPVATSRVSVTPERTTPVLKTRVSVTPKPMPLESLTPVPVPHLSITSVPTEMDVPVLPPLPMTPVSMIPLPMTPASMIPLPITHESMISLPITPNLNHSVGVVLSPNEPKRPDETISNAALAKLPYRQDLVPTSHQELVRTDHDAGLKAQCYKDTAKRKSNRCRSYTHHDQHITDHIPIQLNQEVVIIPKKSSESPNFVSPQQVPSKMRTRRDSVPRRSPTNTSTELHKYRSDVYSPGKLQTPTNVLPDIDVYWKNPLEIKLPKKSSVSPRPKSIENPGHNINLLMSSENHIMRSQRQLISPEIAIPYETQLLYRQENEAYRNHPASVSPARPTDLQAFIQAPLDLSAKLVENPPTPYIDCTYDGYNMIESFKDAEPPHTSDFNTEDHHTEYLNTEITNDDDVVDLRVEKPTDLSINTRLINNFGNTTHKRPEKNSYVQDSISYCKHKQSHESLRSFRTENTEIQFMSCEKTGRHCPSSSEYEIIQPKSDKISDMTGPANFASHNVYKTSEYEYQREYRTLIHDDNYMSRASSRLPQNEKEYQVRAVTEKILFAINQHPYDTTRQKRDWHNKPATITSGAYTTSMPTELEFNNANIAQHNEVILNQGSGDRKSCLPSIQTPIENISSLYLQSSKYRKYHPVPTEDDLHNTSRTDNKIRIDMQSEDFKMVTEKDIVPNNSSKSIKAQPLTCDDKTPSNAGRGSPREIIPEKPESITKTPNPTPVSKSETPKLSMSDNESTSHDLSTSSPRPSANPVLPSELSSDAQSRKIHMPLPQEKPSAEPLIATVSETDVTKINIPTSEVSFSVSKLPNNEMLVDSKNTNLKTSKDYNKFEDRDLDTAKKIAMLPKELVDILGNIPATHRDQLLNILPQYVSAPPPVNTRSDALKETSVVTHVEYNIQRIEQSRDVINLSQSSDLQLKNKHITGKSILDTSNLTQHSPAGVPDSEEEIKPLLDLSIENNKISELKLEKQLDQSSKPYEDYKSKDSVRVIDLTEDENISPNNDIVKTVEEMQHAVTLPHQDIPKLVTVEKPSKKKKNNDQTASLRAVRIKTQSERNKNQISKPVVAEKVSLPSIVFRNDRDNHQEIIPTTMQELIASTTTLAIQQSEISSTQQNNKKILIDSLSPPIMSNQQDWNDANVRDKASTVASEPVILVQVENASDTLNEKVNKSSIVTSSIVAHESAKVNACQTVNTAIAKTCDISNETKEIEKTSAAVEDSSKMHKDADKCLILDMPLPNQEKVISNNPDQDDDSDDDISLAKIVEQKQREDFENKKDKDAETVTREPLRSLTTKKRKKEKKPRKINKKNLKVREISEESMVNLSKNPVNDIINIDKETRLSTPKFDLIVESSLVEDNVPKKNLKKQTASKLKSKTNEIDTVHKKNYKSEEKPCDVKPEKCIRNTSDYSRSNKDESNENKTMKENVEVNNIQKEKSLTDISCNSKNVKQKDNSKKKKRSEKGVGTLKVNEQSTPDRKDETFNEKPIAPMGSMEPENPSTSTALPSVMTKQEQNCEKSVRVSTDLMEHSGTTDKITSEIFDDSSLTPLRRSTRGKSLFMENEATEYEISINNERSSIKKGPITKKQLIFSKLLLDEDVQNKSSSLNLQSENAISNEHQDKQCHKQLQEEDIDNKEGEDSAEKKCKSIKRKKSTQIIRKIKKNKSLDFPVDSEIQTVNGSNADGSEEKYTEVNIKNTRLEPDDSHVLQKAKIDLEGLPDKKSTNKDNKQRMVKEKRKISNVTSSSDNVFYPKTKKSKTSTDMDEPYQEDFKNESDDISTEIPPSKSSGIRATCYNMQVAAKRTRSKSSSVKVTSEYDPYDIDLDDTDFISEPFRKNISVTRDSNEKEVKIQDNTNSLVENSGALNSSDKCQESELQTIQEHSTPVKEGNNKEEPVQEETEKYSIKPKKVLKKALKKAKSAGTKQRKLMKNKLKGYTPRKHGKKSKFDAGDSDDSSKSDVPLKKYAEQKHRYHTEFTLIVEKVRIDIDEPESKIQRQENASTDTNKISESSTSLEDKYMENFGFYSERKPRKSNLLATKKISETFHIIANESDEEKSRKRSTNTETRKTSEGIPECSGYHICVRKARRGRKKRSGTDDDDEDDKCYCGLCRKEFRRPDNYLRHQLTLLHIARIAEVQFKIRTTPMIEEPNFLIVYKQQVDRVRMLIQKQARRKKSKKIKVPTMEEILETVRMVVRAQQLKQRGLSNDEALFLDCCELLQEGPQPKSEAVKIETVQLNTVNELGTSSISDELVEKFDTRSDGDVDSITARNILESEEVRNLENDLISGLKEAAQAKQAEYQQSESAATISNEKCSDEFSSPAVDTHFDQTEESDVSEEITPASKNKTKIPEYKEKMYPDIDDIDMFEDKFDKIKRKCRSQAAAAKQTQSIAEPSSRHKCRKKADKKKIKKMKKSYQNTVLTKGALKGFDGIKVSIPTTDINIAAIVPQADISPKKKKKANSKKKREKKDSVTINERPKDSSVRTKKLDVYEFMDNEEAELFEFRPSTLMERFKSITSKENKSRENSKSNVVSEDLDNLSENGSDGDDFVYMSDDYVCSDDETESSLLSEVGNKTDTKKNTLKKRDAVEKNAVMGKIFKHNAVRSEKKVNKCIDTVEPKANLDQLFDSLLEDEPSSSMLHSISKKNDIDYSSNKKLGDSVKDVLEDQDDSLLKQSPSLSPETYETCTPSTSGLGRYDKIAANQLEDDYLIDFGPSTSKKADELYASLTRIMLSDNCTNEDSNALRKSPPSDSYKITHTDKLSKQKSTVTKLEESLDFDKFNADDTGVARQRARRKCTVGKQNVLAETWSSESEPDGVPARPNSAESVVASSARKKKAKKRDGQHSIRQNSKNVGKKHDVESRVNISNRMNTNNSGESRFSSGAGEEVSEEKAEYSLAEVPPPAPVTSAVRSSGPGTAAKVRPRTTAYYSWSSEGDEEPEHVQQHGWIVGDSHKKLVTMLAHAKGRKRSNDDKRHLLD